jgi:hypothetical protein
MKLINFVSKCKNNKDNETFNRIHGADNNQTFCGKDYLDGTWYVHSNYGKTIADVNCEYCLKAMKKFPKTL